MCNDWYIYLSTLLSIFLRIFRRVYFLVIFVFEKNIFSVLNPVSGKNGCGKSEQNLKFSKFKITNPKRKTQNLISEDKDEVQSYSERTSKLRFKLLQTILF